MAFVPSDVIFCWLSTNASIPAGWTRVTELDARYIQGSQAGGDGDLVTTFGATSHTHTSPSHTPIQNAHTHQVSGSVASTTNNCQLDILGNANVAIDHGHNSKASNGTTATTNPFTITVDAANNDLAFVEVIFIKSDGTPTGLADTMAGFFISDTLPGGWNRVHGNLYVKGAAPGGNGGATGGSLTHTHTSPAHTHTQTSHTHTATSAGPSVVASAVAGATSRASSTHTHSLTLNAATGTNQSTTVIINSANFEPAYTSLNFIQNATGGLSLPTGIIGLWGGLNAAIPADWQRVDTYNKRFSKNSNVDGESGVLTDGSTTHTHTTNGCQPLQNAHTHTVTQGALNGTFLVSITASTLDAALTTHTHTWTVDNATPTHNLATVSINANAIESAYPQYKNLIFISFLGSGTIMVPQLMSLGYGL